MTRTSMLVGTLLLSNLVACLPDDDAPPPPPADTTETSPITTFTSKTGTTVEVFASGGGYSAVEYGDAALPRAIGPTDLATLSPSELFVNASGTNEVPPEVEQMTHRMGPPVRTVSPIPSVPTSALSGCASSAFTAAGYCPSGDRDWCLLNWWNGAYEYMNDIWYSDAYVCVKAGTVLWQIQNGEGGFHQWTVSTGQLFHYYFNDWLDSSWLHYDVLQASGDEFQFGGMAYND